MTADRLATVQTHDIVAIALRQVALRGKVTGSDSEATMHAGSLIGTVIGYAGLLIGAGYSLLVLIATLAWEREVAGFRHAVTDQLPVTVLKPLCGAEPGLYEHLQTFCRQAYSQYQIIFGTLEAGDPALEVVSRLVKEFPALEIDVVVNPTVHGHNYKSSNLINMLSKARYPILVISDSDVWVGPDYLAAVTAPLADPSVGLVTCLSHDEPTRGVWSRVGAMYVNEWYFPSVMLARLFGHKSYASGQTLCFRRGTLERIGGIRRFADHLADDYQLGQEILAQDLRIVLSAYEIRARHHEPTLVAMARHEMRWMRTLHTLQPLCFRLIFLTFSLMLSSAGLVLVGVRQHGLAWGLFCATCLARLGLHFIRRPRRDSTFIADVLLLPLRDLLTCWLWCQSFFSRQVSWRGQEFAVDRAGRMRRLA